MIMNKIPLGATGNPFKSVTVTTLSTAFSPTCLNCINAVWLVGGQKTYNTASHPVLARTTNLTDYTETEFTGASFLVSGVGYTTNGYIVFASKTTSTAAYYLNESISSLADGTDATSFSAYVPRSGCFATGLQVYGNQVYVHGYGLSTYPGLNIYASAMPSFAYTWSDGWTSGNWPVYSAIRETRPIAVTQSGVVGGKSSVGAQYMNFYSPLASTRDMTTSRIAYLNGYTIVGGYRSDGTYIWYTNETPSSGTSWTAQKISSTAGEVLGIGYVNNRFIVLYYASGNKFWASKTNNIGATLVSDYTDSRFSSLGKAVDMQTVNSQTVLLTGAGTTTAEVTVLA